jgi:hypothetical protein
VNFRTRLRRAFPYIVIGIGGFALAYVVIFAFVLPSKLVPTAPQPYVPDSSRSLRPIDTGMAPPAAPAAPIEPPSVTAHIVQAPATDTVPIIAPDLVGMPLPDARGVLNGLRLRTAITRDTSSFQPPNTVLRQLPAPDSAIKVGGTVTLTVSHFPPDTAPDTMRVQRGKTLPPIRPVPDTIPRPRPDTLRPE